MIIVKYEYSSSQAKTEAEHIVREYEKIGLKAIAVSSQIDILVLPYQNQSK